MSPWSATWSGAEGKASPTDGSTSSLLAEWVFCLGRGPEAQRIHPPWRQRSAVVAAGSRRHIFQSMHFIFITGHWKLGGRKAHRSPEGGFPVTLGTSRDLLSHMSVPGGWRWCSETESTSRHRDWASPFSTQRAVRPLSFSGMCGFPAEDAEALSAVASWSLRPI